MVKLVFAPIGFITGFAAGVAARKGFERIWAVFDEDEPPQPDQRDAPMVKMVAALAIEGVVFRVVKGVTDHGTRRAVAGFTGRWPGEEPAAEAAEEP